MPDVIAARWMSSTRSSGNSSASMLAEYSTITCGMVSPPVVTARVDERSKFSHVLGEPSHRVKAVERRLKLRSSPRKRGPGASEQERLDSRFRGNEREWAY